MVRRFPALHGEQDPDDRGDRGLDHPFSTVVCHPERLDKPLHWRKPRVVLVSMLGDLFHEQVPFSFVDEVEAIMCRAGKHRFCVLTKRPARLAEYMRQISTPPPNIFPMASVWDQPSTDAACAAFASLPEGVRWGLHVEPMLAAIDMRKAQPRVADRLPAWVVCGGENGPGARPMNPQWALDLREQCRAAGVPFWFKGWGSRPTWTDSTDPTLNVLEQTREVPW